MDEGGLGERGIGGAASRDKFSRISAKEPGAASPSPAVDFLLLLFLSETQTRMMTMLTFYR